MKVLDRPAVVILGTAVLFAATASAQTDRLTDKDVKTLLETVDNDRDRFEDQLDGKLKGSIVRGPAGEVNVGRFLDDLQENTGNLKDRFKPEYAASSEVATVLRQATTIQRFMKEQPPDFKGSSEWDHFAGNLTRLATAYGTTFPLEGTGPVRRINDNEAAAAAEAIEKHAGEFKNAVNREKALAKPAKTNLTEAADLLKNSAKTLKSRLKDSKPATAEARQLFDVLRKMGDSTKDLGLSPASLSAMGSLRAPLATLNQAFGVTGVPGT
jgi:hypothetical protein